MEIMNDLSRVDVKLVVRDNKMRSCILGVVRILGTMFGRRGTLEKMRRWMEFTANEFPFPRNVSFVGCKTEMFELESLLFGDVEEKGEDVVLRSNEK